MNEGFHRISSINGQFSIAMSVYQRVHICPIQKIESVVLTVLSELLICIGSLDRACLCRLQGDTWFAVESLPKSLKSAKNMRLTMSSIIFALYA